MRLMILNCFKCEREITESVDAEINQPYGATTFMTYGHYGSTFYDEMSGRFLEINICDDCLNKALDKDLILEIHPAPRPPQPIAGRVLYNRELLDAQAEAHRKAWENYKYEDGQWEDDLLSE